MIHAAREAGKVLLKYYGKSFSIKEKDIDNIVTEADKEAEQKILDILNHEYDFNVFSEEFGESDTKSDYTWIIDPIDGTSNFVKRIPYFCTSIGLFKNGLPEAGVVFQPAFEELFHAEAGRGAFLNNRSLSIKELSPPVLLSCNHGYGKVARLKHVDALQGIMQVFDNNRLYGASALDLAYLADGRLDCFVTFGDELYDVAAGILIAKEAGYEISNWKGEEWTTDMPDLLVVHPGLKNKIVELISGTSDWQSGEPNKSDVN